MNSDITSTSVCSCKVFASTSDRRLEDDGKKADSIRLDLSYNFLDP